MITLFLASSESALTLTVVLLPLRLGFAVAWIWSYLSMRQSLEARFALNLSGILTFFFTVFYLQYHMTRIAKGEHSPYRPVCFFQPISGERQVPSPVSIAGRYCGLLYPVSWPASPR